jgi:hypothetical protein
VVVTGQVLRIHAPRVFTIRSETDGQEWLVLATRPVSPAIEGGTVRVGGALRRLDLAELKRIAGSSALDETTRTRLTTRPVLIASTLIAAVRGEAPPEAEAPTAPPIETALPPRESPPLTLPTTTFVADIEGFAGRPIRLLNARVVGVLEPGAFLVEPATNYLKPMGERDRVLVLVRGGALRVRPELIVGSTVKVLGAARTVVGLQVTAEVPWPARLEPEFIERLEVRAAILATSVRTADDVELTTLSSAPQP